MQIPNLHMQMSREGRGEGGRGKRVGGEGQRIGRHEAKTAATKCRPAWVAAQLKLKTHMADVVK